MGEAYSFEIRERAADLYVTEGYTFEQVSKATGVSVSQLKAWSGQEGWQEQKREYRKALSDIKRTSIKLQRELLMQALEKMDPQLVYAAARLMSTLKQKGALDQPQMDAEAERKKELDAETLKKIREQVYGID